MSTDNNTNASLSNENLTQFRAIQLVSYGGADAIKVATVEAPKGPAAGQVLVRVHAAGVNGLDWKIREGYVRDVFPLELPATLGLEIAGVVVAVGGGVDRFQVGDRVMGWLGAIGAYADQVVASADNLGHIPEGMDFVQAAGLPTVVQAAWQSLQAFGPVSEGTRVLIHGAAGAVGAFAVQFARQSGATVYASARGEYGDYLRELGANVVIDYKTERFEDKAQDIDLVLDLIGGETLDRSWSVLSPNGMIVSTAAPDAAAKAPAGKKGLFLMTKADPAQVEQTAKDIVEGRVNQKIEAVVSLEEAPEAIERNRTEPHIGKTVVALVPAG